MKETSVKARATQSKELEFCQKNLSVGELVVLTGKDWQELFSPSTRGIMVKPKWNQDNLTEFLLVLT